MTLKPIALIALDPKIRGVANFYDDEAAQIDEGDSTVS